MRYRLYTEKTIAQSMSAINERLHQKGTATRVALDGWVEKGGTFSISMTAPVARQFSRTTRLSGRMERSSGVTIVEGSVPGGVDARGRVLVYAALAVAALAIFASGSPAAALLFLPLGAALYLPMKGDHDHSAVLIAELQKTLRARATPPKPPKTPAKAVAKAGQRAAAQDEDDEDS
jgi:hypothetical protein